MFEIRNQTIYHVKTSTYFFSPPMKVCASGTFPLNCAELKSKPGFSSWNRCVKIDQKRLAAEFQLNWGQTEAILHHDSGRLEACPLMMQHIGRYAPSLLQSLSNAISAA